MSFYYKLVTKYPPPYNYLYQYNHSKSLFDSRGEEDKFQPFIIEEDNCVIEQFPTVYRSKLAVLNSIFFPIIKHEIYGNDITGSKYYREYQLFNNIRDYIKGDTDFLSSLYVMSTKLLKDTRILNAKWTPVIYMSDLRQASLSSSFSSYKYKLSIISKKHFTDDVFIPIERLSYHIKRKV